MGTLVIGSLKLKAFKMTFKGLCTLLVAGLFLVELGSCVNMGFNGEFETCWESCFQVIDEDASTKMYRQAYHEFYEMGAEARRLKNMRSVNGTTLLLDSTLSQWHDPATNLNLEEHEKGANIWKFQRNLASITAMFICNGEDHNPMSIVQFNEDAAWTCDTHTCLSSCMAVDILQDDTDKYLYPLQMNATSHKDANMEPACRLGYTNLHTDAAGRITCTRTEIDREMAIAVVNSDFDSHVHESDEWDDFSPCDEHFDTRYIIGTHAADYHELRDWSSLDARPNYIKDSAYTMEAAEHLVTCMKSACCKFPPYITDVSTTCVKSTDHWGENSVPFTDHPANT